MYAHVACSALGVPLSGAEDRLANQCKSCRPPPHDPRSTPVSDAEMRLLTSKPVWRISWCEDERAAQVRCLCLRVLGLLLLVFAAAASRAEGECGCGV